MTPRPDSFAFRYGWALFSVVLATWVRHLLDPLLGFKFPFATLFFAILLTARYGGFRPALLAVVLGAFLSDYFLLPPRASFALAGWDQSVGLALYVSIGLGIALLGGAMQAAWQRAQASALAERHQALQIDQLAKALQKTNEELELRAAAVLRASEEQAATGIRQLNAELEERVRVRTAELEAANQELEAFSYSVSHDLRAPLRAIDGFSRIVIEDFAPQLPAEAQSYLEDVRASTKRMGQLMDDLLTFSQLVRQPIRLQPVPMTELVQRCLYELHSTYPGRQVVIEVDELPACQADPALLKQVWLNLLANAIKYTGKCAAAVIQVGSTTGPDGPTYFVKDNGVGFDMRYLDKLFKVFQRLHRAEEYEGTGVGLAIVQRIIHRHGGRVWAVAQRDHGATFFFTLSPSKATDHD